VPSTGAGGANMWSHAALVGLAPAAAGLRPLPAGVDVGYASRRCLRGGALAGVPLEEFGVRPDREHLLTRDDVLGGNDDLLRAAAALLHDLPVRRLDVQLAPRTGAVAVAVTSEAVDRLDVYVGTRPVATLDVPVAETGTEVVVAAGPGDVVVVRGYLAGNLVAARRQEVPEPAPVPTPPAPPADRR
jgi:hypothetical protein